MDRHDVEKDNELKDLGCGDQLNLRHGINVTIVVLHAVACQLLPEVDKDEKRTVEYNTYPTCHFTVKERVCTLAYSLDLYSM